MTFKKLVHSFAFQWFLVAAICMVIRLPYFLGPHLYFDGDEAILGIMAQDLLHGKNIPVYFYGQQYGFSLFEVISTAIFIFIFGSNVWALKLGALLIFSLGSTFLFRLIFKKTNLFGWSLLGIFLLMLFPSWMIWATKDRGGYVTAYALACIILYITQLRSAHFWTILLVSILVALLAHSQLFIGIPVFLLVAYWLLSARKWKFILWALVCVMASYFIFKLPAYLNPDYWKSPVANGFSLARIPKLLRELPNVTMGYFYYEMTFPVPKLVKIFATIYFALLGIAGSWVLLKAENKTKASIFLLFGGAVVSFLLLPTMKFDSYRYYLGFLTGIMFIFALIIPSLIKMKGKIKLILILLIPSAVVFSFTSKNIPDSWMLPEGNDMQLYTEFTEALKKSNPCYIYSTDPTLQWMLNYSGFRVRHTSANERTDRYMWVSGWCYFGDHAIVGYKGMCLGMDQDSLWGKKVMYVNDKFFIYRGPDAELLKLGGYELK